VLRRPMAPAEVSALNVIGAQHAEPEDADLLVAVLACSDSDAVRNEAIWMASGVFGKAETKDARLVAALGDLILGPGFSLTKETAIRVWPRASERTRMTSFSERSAKATRRRRLTQPVSWSRPEAWNGTAPPWWRSPRAGRAGLPVIPGGGTRSS
jgi:hypothetical protein